MLFFNNNLHFLLDILHIALPSGKTYQLCNKSFQKKKKKKNAIPSLDATTFASCTTELSL